jgi:hypothetical protein
MLRLLAVIAANLATAPKKMFNPAVGKWWLWLALAACVKVTDRGDYPRVKTQPGASIPLRVSVMPFTSRDPGAGERLSAAFARDLDASHIFSAAGPSLPYPDLIINGNAVVLKQPGDEKKGVSTGESILIIPLYALWGVGILFGVPSDCGDAKAELELTAWNPHTGAPVWKWQAAADGSECAGLYYSGWPMGDALHNTVGKLLQQIRAAAPELARRVRPPS